MRRGRILVRTAQAKAVRPGREVRASLAEGGSLRPGYAILAPSAPLHPIFREQKDRLMAESAADPVLSIPVLSIEVERCLGDVFVLRCHGRLVAGATDILTRAVTPLVTQSKRIVLDLSDLKHTDSMGLGTLARLFVSAKAAGCSLELMHLSQQIRNLLGLTHMFSVFTVIGENGIKFL